MYNITTHSMYLCITANLSVRLLLISCIYYVCYENIDVCTVMYVRITDIINKVVDRMHVTEEGMGL